MRFRTGLLVGLAVGYYYGAKAGPERAVEIDAWLDRVRATTTFQDARTKVADGLREGTTAARHLLDETSLQRGGAAAPDTATRALFSDPTLN